MKTSLASAPLENIEALDKELLGSFQHRMRIEPLLSRQLVSFQGNKTKASYRWYKYKEAFSAALAEYLLCSYGGVTGRMLDPFAGSGTALFVASEAGIDADGIELLPIGQQIIQTRLTLTQKFDACDFSRLDYWQSHRPWNRSDARWILPTLRITEGAYPPETLNAIERYMGTCLQENARVQQALRFALLCVLEAVSYTRKDGQYLRWDLRSGRKQGKRPFNKGPILSFDNAICAKINEIIHDMRFDTQPLDLFAEELLQPGTVSLREGSCLEQLPLLSKASYDAILTSPPYCNRYDYTRTYALELALLGVGTQEILRLRQQLLTCTVENRPKDLLQMQPSWASAVAAADNLELLQAILSYLDGEKERGALNNQGIPRMVRGYFYEMACVISECARVLKPGGLLFMVNDNVRYSGASISVDLILSALAERLGFAVQNILVLPNGKGNSSQQMGEHGRESLRKCVYVWRKA
ncbi:MAG TPA: site-specific DNA-methyltransferase [Chthonomonadaceae bacterium]|nr:site-specific DNA-methyltransferase [Chthonomonadaceae bacterium]